MLEQSWAELLKEVHILLHPAALIPDGPALPLVFKAHAQMASPVIDSNMTGEVPCQGNLLLWLLPQLVVCLGVSQSALLIQSARPMHHTFH